MHAESDPTRIREFLRRFGQEVRGPGTIYLTGGATALLLGWRQATLDVDLSIDAISRTCVRWSGWAS